MLTHTLGFPRVGADRELKKALEAFWQGQGGEADLQRVARELRSRHWRLQADRGVDVVPVGDFSLYDHVLDTTAMLGAVPDRYGWRGDSVDLGTYFRMARGDGGMGSVGAMEMSKWFDTNYHYIVPELGPGQTFRLGSRTLLDQVDEARAAGVRARPVLLGPLTYLRLAKPTVEGFDPLEHAGAILPVYEQVLRELSRSVEWVQIDEPALVLDLSERETLLFRLMQERLARAAAPARILLATYFGGLGENVALACMPPIGALHVDLVRAPDQLESVLARLGADQSLSLGVIDGRNIWRVAADRVLAQIDRVVGKVGSERVMIAPSCSLLHVPVDLDRETGLDPEVRSWLAFAAQKCDELRLLADAAAGREGARSGLEANRAAWRSRRASPRVVDPRVRARVAALAGRKTARRSPHARRQAVQRLTLGLPALPTTTIGSFPQTAAVRAARARFRQQGTGGAAEYTEAMRGFIREAVARQHELGLDVLVHGEPERNDMVEYFAEQMAGFCVTGNGWVQSYGSRCVKPPIIFGDVSRPAPMTVEWIRYAQSLTDRPMKGMLTGPVTMLCWSFARDDQPDRETCLQIALAIRDEMSDLEQAGIRIIQVDEAALREGLPLRHAEWHDYLQWAVEAFRLATSDVRDETQIHTHMCYSEFNDIVEWIARMDADVISIEASRSKMDLLTAFQRFQYPNEIGPGVYDIHSPRVPSVAEISQLVRQTLQVIPADRVWINPDCGLKTRAWPEAVASLQNLVAAAKAVRAELDE